MYRYIIHTTGIDAKYRQYVDGIRSMSVGFTTDESIETQLDNDKTYIKTPKGHYIMKNSITVIEDHTPATIEG